MKELAKFCPVCGGERAFRSYPEQKLCNGANACLQALLDEVKRQKAEEGVTDCST